MTGGLRVIGGAEIERDAVELLEDALAKARSDDQDVQVLNAIVVLVVKRADGRRQHWYRASKMLDRTQVIGHLVELQHIIVNSESSDG